MGQGVLGACLTGKRHTMMWDGWNGKGGRHCIGSCRVRGDGRWWLRIDRLPYIIADGGTNVHTIPRGTYTHAHYIEPRKVAGIGWCMVLFCRGPPRAFFFLSHVSTFCVTRQLTGEL